MNLKIDLRSKGRSESSGGRWVEFLAYNGILIEISILPPGNGLSLTENRSHCCIAS